MQPLVENELVGSFVSTVNEIIYEVQDTIDSGKELASSITDTINTVKETVIDVKEKVSETIDTVKDTVNEVTSTVNDAVDSVKKAGKQIGNQLKQKKNLDDFKKLAGWMKTGFKIYMTLEKLKFIKDIVPDFIADWIDTASQVGEVIKVGLEWWSYGELNRVNSDEKKNDKPDKKVSASNKKKIVDYYIFFNLFSFSLRRKSRSIKRR
jgi:uncharacterized protein YoxC